MFVRFLVLLMTITVFSPTGAFAAAEDTKFDALKRFSQVLDLVERYYVKDTPRKDLINGAIKGMLQGLDPHSTFMSPEEYKEMQETTTGEFFGVGIEISMENNQVIVVTPIEDTPAFRSGIQSGDIILSINGQPTQELTLQEVVSRIRGPKGSPVELSVIHADSKAPQTVSIVRDAIPLVSVKSRVLEDGYQWIRLTRFSDRTTQELAEALKEATKKQPLKGIVLDLRNNPGGLLDQAVSVSDMFLKSGDIVSIRGRQDASIKEYKATEQKTDITVPMVVLVNAGSASASEIVAGALRDQKRALIVGERTFGKGSVQNIIPLADGSGLKITIALYYTPNGSSIQAEGIVPDLEIPFEPARPEDKKTPRQMLREKDLSRHLETGNKSTDKKGAVTPPAVDKTDKSIKDTSPKDKPATGKPVSEKNVEVKELLEKDNQLRMALQFVKSLPKLRELKN